MQLDFPEKLQLANTPTPIQPLDRLSESLGCRLWVKRDDLTGSATSGNKIRKLEYSLARAKQQGADVIITCGGVQSNHCRATALLGAQLGFKVHLLLRGEEPQDHQGNLMLDQVAGATISYFAPRYYNSRFDFVLSEVISDYKSQGLNPYFITTGASDATGVWGYVAAVEEIASQREVSFDHIITATGSGGTQAGLTLGASIYMPESRVTGMAVCDDEAYFNNKVHDDLTAWAERYKQPLEVDQLSINVCDQYIGPGYAKAGREIFKCIEMVARTEGIVLDPVYTGKAFFGMLAEIENGNLYGENILFVHTGGIFGLMAQPNEYQQNRQQ